MINSIKTVIITGGLGLIGKPLSEYLITKGFHVLIIDRLEPESLNENIDYIKFDLSNINEFDQLIKQIKHKKFKIKGLVNNAAINPMIEMGAENFGKFEDLELNKWNEELNINLSSPVFLSKAILRIFDFSEGDNCKIVNVLSQYGLVPPNPNLYKEYSKKIGVNIYKPISYSVAKAALGMVTKYLAVYLAKEQINVNAIAPGGIENKQDQSFIDEYNKLTPMGKMAKPKDLVEAVRFLLSQDSNYMTGQILSIDGGWTVW